MRKPAQGEYRSAVYTNRPPYADYDAPRKFMAIQAIVGKRLLEHPRAICSYSGGADSDILVDLVERARAEFHLPPVKYEFINMGLEMAATKNHVVHTAQKYGIEIETVPEKTAHWNRCEGRGHNWQCSNCYEKINYNEERKLKQKRVFPVWIVNRYCRGCGARMVGAMYD